MGEHKGLRLLLDLVEPEHAERAGRRLGYRAENPIAVKLRQHTMRTAVSHLAYADAPASLVMWMVERDDPIVNAVLVEESIVPEALRYDLSRGVPFGPHNTTPVPLTEGMRRYAKWASDEPPLSLAAMRAADSMRKARTAVKRVSTVDWPLIAEADRSQPLPGYVRWALSIRVDCPAQVREQFGSHRKFAHRLRQARVVSGPAEYIREWKPARTVLEVLDTGLMVFVAERVREIQDTLRPPACDTLGGNVEAWAVFAQLLPTFTGTLPELMESSAAIAGGGTG